jgi:hypothetical protein
MKDVVKTDPFRVKSTITYPLNVVRKSPPSCSLYGEEIMSVKILRPINSCGDISHKSDKGTMKGKV